MPAPAFIGLALVLAAAAPAWAGAAGDRLERFREIAATRLSVVEDTGRALDPASQGEIKPGSVYLRHEVRYPGWKPGCDVQAEQEDRYRGDPRGGLALVSRQLFNGWHRDLQRSATRLFSTLVSGDRKSLAELVPDTAVRARLPALLWAEAVCDAEISGTPVVAVVAAVAPLPDGRREPWSLWWRRGAAGWRLTGAAPVLE